MQAEMDTNRHKSPESPLVANDSREPLMSAAFAKWKRKDLD